MSTDLGGVPETLLITVRARALETKRKKPILSDPYAVAILETLNLPADRKDKVNKGSQLGCVIRSVNIDRIVRNFLERHPDGVVVSLGCGLEARYERVGKNCAGWWDLDVPETIAIRRRFFRETNNYTMVACSMFDYAWMDGIPKDRPVIVLSEGVFMYFPEEELKGLCAKIFSTSPKSR